ncbi:interleukin-2 receptor subunit beta-like [Rhinoraja longicauda]
MREIVLIIFTASLWASSLGSKCENKDLKCDVDYTDKMTCCWSQNVSRSDTCQVRVEDLQPSKDSSPHTCAPVNGQARSCIVDVEFFAVSQVLNVTLLCTRDGLTTAVAAIPRFRPALNIQLQPPGNLTVINNTDIMTILSWRTDYDVRLSSKIKFEVRYKLENDQWKRARTLHVPTKERRLRIDSSNLKPGATFAAQIRAKISDYHEVSYKSTWSKWSPVVKWKTKKSQASADQQENIVLSIALSSGGILLVVAILLIVQFTTKRSRLKALYGFPIPDPSKFFYELNSTYGGNFQRWLGTRFPASFSSTEELATEISSVEISEIKDAQSCKQNLSLDGSGLRSTGDSSTSSFANQGYFLFNLSKASEAYPCKIYFSNHPASRGEGSEGSRSYRCLTSSSSSNDEDDSDSLYDGGLLDSPGGLSAGKKGLDLDGGDPGSHGVGETSEEEVDGPPGEHGGPAAPPYPGNPASQGNPSKETNCPFEGLFQFPTLESSACFFQPYLSSADTEDEGVHGPPLEKPPMGAPCPQDLFTQQGPGVYKTNSLNLAEEADAYLSLKQVHSKYNSQSI